MKFYIVLIAIFASLPTHARQEAQQHHRTMEDRVESRLEYLSIVLDLSDAQITDIRTLQQDHISSVKEIRSDFEPVLTELKNALKDIRLGSEGNFDASRDAAKEVREVFKPQLEPMKEAINSERAAFDRVLAQVFSPQQSERYEALKAFKEEKRALDKNHPKKHR